MFLFVFIAIYYTWISIQAENVIKINKNLIEKKRGECFEFQAEHYFPTNSSPIFVWKKRHTTTIYPDNRISISRGGKELVIKHLTEADTALYSSEVKTKGGLEITQYWLVVRGCDVNEKEIDFKDCETACEAVCLKDWYQFGDKCFRYFSNPKSWLDAHSHCQAAFSAKLATVENEEENRFVGNLLKSGYGAWIGLNDRSSEGKFLWNYNKYNRPTYFAWDKANTDNPEPNNFNGQCNVENCVEMKHTNKRWNDVVCKAHNDYVCMRKSQIDLPGWRCQEGKCYLYVRDAVTWDWAQQSCRNRNSTLVTISSSEENEIIGSLVRSTVWIGLNDRVEAGLYVWNDIAQGKFDNRPTYYNWELGEPNDRHYDPFKAPRRCKGEDCVQIKSWNDVISWCDLDCDIQLPYICEKSRDLNISFAAWVAISMGAGLIISIFGGRAYMEYKTRGGRKDVKQILEES
ncbi:C-type mannose receptor 2-like [Montipora capricornis]|uniref:C-type mannose receptor 2-like n=1 Tax=Montipora capricornis TaxID=246305 RepID=UPI0035F1A875